MISGNGSVMGHPYDDLVIVNHAKCWVVGSDYRPKATGRGTLQEGLYFFGVRADDGSNHTDSFREKSGLLLSSAGIGVFIGGSTPQCNPV